MHRRYDLGTQSFNKRRFYKGGNVIFSVIKNLEKFQSTRKSTNPSKTVLCLIIDVSKTVKILKTFYFAFSIVENTLVCFHSIFIDNVITYT